MAIASAIEGARAGTTPPLMLRLFIATLCAVLATVSAPSADARRTVCTITVNSTDEREAFRRHLPEKDYEFVELVERGRPDWLATACKQQVRCDVLVISGHFNGNDFFSDQLSVAEHLPVAEMERASCSDSCPGLFSQLKEVYMFGCDSLNGERMQGVAAEVARTLVKGGQSKADADRTAQALADAHSESNRDVMRRVFVNTPAVYGFSSVAPVGAVAGPILSRYLQTSSPGDIGSGRPNAKLLAHFSPHAMTMTSGLRDQDARATQRAQVCRFADDRLDAARKLAFVHELVRESPAQARYHLDRIERFVAALGDGQRNSPTVAQALQQIAADSAARERFLDFARDTDTASTRARMTAVANALGWLSPEQYREETVRQLADLVAADRTPSPADIDQVCKLNRDDAFSSELTTLRAAAGTTTAHAAALACLGSPEHHEAMLQALASVSERDVEVAEVYFHHRPIAAAAELRTVADAITRLSRTDAQVRALNALARQRVADVEGLDPLARLFPVAETVAVQRAIASVFIRTDHHAIATPELIRVFRDHRKAGAANDVIDVLIRRLERAMSLAGAQARRS